MDNMEVQSLAENPNMLSNMFFETAEVQKITGEVNRLIKDVSDQTNENLQERNQISEMLEQYDTKFAQHESLRNELEDLKGRMKTVSQNMSKDKVLMTLGQRARMSEQKSTALEKQVIKHEIDIKTFMQQYVKERSDYHKYQMLKVKVAQSS